MVSEGWVRKPPIYVHVTPFKFTVLQELLTHMKGRTLIYCDTIELGKESSKLLDLLEKTLHFINPEYGLGGQAVHVLPELKDLHFQNLYYVLQGSHPQRAR